MKEINDLTDDEFAAVVQRAARLPEAPTEIVQAAMNLLSGTGSPRAGSLVETAGQIIQAVLSFDSWARPAVAFGMRSAGSEKRHLLFSAGERDIDLRISPEAEGFILTGQVLGPDEGGTVELAVDSSRSEVQAGTDRRTSDGKATTLDQLGEFRLKEILAGTYRLTLRLGSDEVVLRPIVIGERQE